MNVQPYRAVAPAIYESGLGGPLPVPYRAKSAPPIGWTGRGAPYPDAEQVERWRRVCPGWNVGIRLTENLVAVDADTYKPEGAASLERLVAQCGQLPPTFVNTSRTDGSGQRWYRVPIGVRWAERQAGDGIDLLHSGHRYAVVWPSSHPSGATYRWYDPAGRPMDRVPTLDELPSLPASWGRKLSRQAVAPATGLLRTGAPEVADKYADAALAGAVADLLAIRPGQRVNDTANIKAFALGGLVAAGLLDESTVRNELLAALRSNGYVDEAGERQALATIESGLRAGMARPRAPRSQTGRAAA